MWVAPSPMYWRYPPLNIRSLSSSEIPCAKAAIGINKNINIKNLYEMKERMLVANRIFLTSKIISDRMMAFFEFLPSLFLH